MGKIRSDLKTENNTTIDKKIIDARLENKASFFIQIILVLFSLFSTNDNIYLKDLGTKKPARRSVLSCYFFISGKMIDNNV